MIRFWKNLALISLVLTMFLGCNSRSLTKSSITNLTPPTLTANEAGLYMVECYWRSNQQSLKEDTIKAVVRIGTEDFPMRKTPKLPNRWEALIPVDPAKGWIEYRFKFDYEYAAIPERRKDSRLSEPFQLKIVP